MYVESRAGVQENRCETDALCGSHRRPGPGGRDIVQQRSSKTVRKIDTGSFQDHLEARQVTVALGFWMASERLHEPPLPPGIASGPIQVLERHPDEIDVAAGGRAEQELLGDRAARRHQAFLQTAGGFVFEQPPQSLRQPEVAGRPRVHESTVTFQELHHGSILPGVRFIHRRAGGVDVRVRAGSLLQQDFRHDGLTQDRALTERLAPGYTTSSRPSTRSRSSGSSPRSSNSVSISGRSDCTA